MEYPAPEKKQGTKKIYVILLTFKIKVMKTTFNSLFNQLSTTTSESNAKEDKGTTASEILQHQHKNFSAAELWNIQRQIKSRVQRRYM